MAHLLILTGAQEGKTFPIDPGLTLGREAHNSLPMPDNKKSSRDHAKVWRTGPGRYEVADLGSTNGTFLNDDRISHATLKDGDLVRVGDVELRFVLDEDEKPKPKAKAAAERPNLADVLKGKAKPEGVAAATGAAAIEIKSRILQYNKKSAKGSVLGVDVSQTAGASRWVFVGIALAVAVGLFFLVRTVVVGTRAATPPGGTPTDDAAPADPGDGR